MHARFNLDPQKENWSAYLEEGNRIHAANKIVVEEDLDKFKDANGILAADKIIESWFPNIKSDVFLSHSHKDAEIVKGLGGWLKKNLGLTSFIDSTVWGYADRLLKLIDDVHCKSGQTYNYNLRNRSTSHVHLMLLNALTTVMDRCECIIFVNTPSSFKPSDYLKDEGKTESPWIYSEIAMTRILRQRTAAEHRPSPILDSLNASTEDLKENLKIEYPLGLFHLTPLTSKDLESWSTECFLHNAKGAAALDSLYRMKRKIQNGTMGSHPSK